ncbi:MAG: hypothetical protein KatS3mg105_1635 [Gemmatales bacterium]|nr:MAG: hypothetical protein KatS3mg105_1635 [Gemmatales bacterium]
MSGIRFLCCLGVLAWSTHDNYVQAEEKRHAFVFKDMAQKAGLLPAAAGIHGHGAAWGDVDGDGWLDLYIGTFHESGSKANMLFRNRQGRFHLDEQEGLRIGARATGVVFADFDNDGDLDLFIGSMPKPKAGLRGCALFRNDGNGKFADISKDCGACPGDFGGRSAAVFDYDGDGLLDLLVGEDPLPGYNGSKTKSSRLFRNLGELRFADVSRQVGIPEGIPGLGVAAGDVNNDGWPDFFLASSRGGNILFLNQQGKTFRAWQGSQTTFVFPNAGAAGGDNMICGVCFGDVNRDGLLDIAIGPHYSTPWRQPVAVHLYLNRGIRNREPIFENVTAKVGLFPLPLKAPHVELQDFDNDGWPDLFASIVKFADGQSYPLIFKNHGLRNGLPVFREDIMEVNDFPTAEDKAIPRSGPFFSKMIKDKKIVYTAAAPTADYDNDGKLDIFLANWWIEAPSLLLHNETPAGNWLQVRLEGKKRGMNRMGIGAKINLYRSGKAGDPGAFLGSREVAVGFGYASGQPAIAHFGLGSETAVDIEVILPHGKGKLLRRNIRGNQRFLVTID